MAARFSRLLKNSYFIKYLFSPLTGENNREGDFLLIWQGFERYS